MRTAFFLFFSCKDVKFTRKRQNQAKKLVLATHARGIHHMMGYVTVAAPCDITIRFGKHFYSFGKDFTLVLLFIYFINNKNKRKFFSCKLVFSKVTTNAFQRRTTIPIQLEIYYAQDLHVLVLRDITLN